jgi:hypothetical protein
MALDLGIMSALSIACQSHAAMVGRHVRIHPIGSRNSAPSVRTVDPLAPRPNFQHIVGSRSHQRYRIAPNWTDGCWNVQPHRPWTLTTLPPDGPPMDVNDRHLRAPEATRLMARPRLRHTGCSNPTRPGRLPCNQ